MCQNWVQVFFDLEKPISDQERYQNITELMKACDAHFKKQSGKQAAQLAHDFLAAYQLAKATNPNSFQA